MLNFTTILLGVVGLVMLHEAAHAAMAQSLGLSWHPFFKLPWKAGIAVWVFTAWQSRLIALSGPAINLIVAVPLLLVGGFTCTRLAVLSVAMATAPSIVDWVAARRAKDVL